ncbi:hypothetical protein ES703_47306 [subsurface metagenome]|jgi:hypothetical protein
MPKEVFDVDEFLALSQGAPKCIVKRLGDVTKLKVRSGRYLYTIQLATSEAEGLLGRIQCPKEEL